MKAFLKRKNVFSLRSSLSMTAAFLFLSVCAVAQNVADSDLDNSAGTNKNWYGSMWFFGVVIALIIVMVIAFSRKRKRSAADISGREQRR